MPPRGRIFERFSRLESSRTTEGSGLGLSIVTAIAEAHGGTVASLLPERMTTKTQSLGVQEAQVLVLGSQIWAGAP